MKECHVSYKSITHFHDFFGESFIRYTFLFHHPNQCDAVCHCNLDLHFLITNDVEQLSMYLLDNGLSSWKNVYPCPSVHLKLISFIFVDL